LNVPGIVGFGHALALCAAEMPAEMARLRRLRDRLFQGLQETVPGVSLNGPALAPPDLRLAVNLNCCFAGVEGEALMLGMRDLAVSSGSACASGSPEPSHVLRSLGLTDDAARSSLRFGLGRFNDEAEIDFAIALISATVARLRALAAGA
jgi:cysteine desulfurase